MPKLATSKDSSSPKVKVTSGVEAVGNLIQHNDFSRLTPGNVYDGKVISVDYVTKKITVEIEGYFYADCRYVAGAVGQLLGICSNQLPGPGTEVVCLSTRYALYVIGASPHTYFDTESIYQNISGDFDTILPNDLPAKPVATAEYYEDSTSRQVAGYPLSNDIVPGEQEYENNIGILFRLLVNLIQMDSGGLSLIEQSITNDMIRMASQYFVHHSCGGDTLIWNTGRTTLEHHFTGYPTEALGLKNDGTGDVAQGTNGIYELTDQDDPIDATGRWRSSTYLGFLGDMLHYWVTNPTEVTSNYKKGAQRHANFRTWVGSDGTFMIQGAGDIVVEATSYLVVPEIFHKWDNPEAELEKQMKNLNREYLKLWGGGKDRWKDLNASVWQMRQYLRYITIWHSLERFRQLTEGEYCKIAPESESKMGDRDCDEQDKKDAGLSSDDPKPYRSIFRCSPDGSSEVIAVGEKGISSVILNQGNVQISAANNIELRAPGTISIIGKDVSIQGKRILELISHTGSIVSKAKTCWKALCERGRLWLKSDMKKGDTFAADDETGLDPEFDEYSVVIDSSRGKTLVHGDEGATVGTTGPEAKVTLEALGGMGEVNIKGRNMNVLMENDVLVNATARVGVSCLTSAISTQLHKIGDGVLISNSCMDIDPMIRAGQAYFQQVFSANGYTGNNEHNLVYDKEETDLESLKPQTKNDATDGLQKDAGSLEEEDVVDDYPESEFRGKYKDWEFYNWKIGDDLESPNSLKADPWTDNVLVVGDDTIGPKDIQQYPQHKTGPLPAPRTSTSFRPWPGNDAVVFMFQNGGEGFAQLMEADFSTSDIGSAADMHSRPIIYLFNINDD